MVAFASTYYACKWCLLVQEELLHTDWPKPILDYKDAAVELNSERSLFIVGSNTF